jgi:outer membrane lipoprotein SlyB
MLEELRRIDMKNLRFPIVVAIMLSGTTAWAGYSCPLPGSTGGGWTPPECVQAQRELCADCAVVEAVNIMQTEEASGLGAAAGAVAGGVLGNQVGKGSGRTLATVIGAVGGGVAGHYGEKMLRKKSRWDVVVLMEDGTHRTLAFDADPGYQAGDKVRVNGSSLSRQ